MKDSSGYRSAEPPSDEGVELVAEEELSDNGLAAAEVIRIADSDQEAVEAKPTGSIKYVPRKFFDHGGLTVEEVEIPISEFAAQLEIDGKQRDSRERRLRRYVTTTVAALVIVMGAVAGIIVITQSLPGVSLLFCAGLVILGFAALSDKPKKWLQVIVEAIRGWSGKSGPG